MGEVDRSRDNNVEAEEAAGGRRGAEAQVQAWAAWGQAAVGRTAIKKAAAAAVAAVRAMRRRKEPPENPGIYG